MAAARIAEGLGFALVKVGGNVTEATLLIIRGADVNYVVREMQDGQEQSATPLVSAAGGGHGNVVNVLIEKGADVNKPEPCSGHTPLRVAVQRGRKAIAICLLDHGADVDARNNEGLQFTALLDAAQRGHLPLANLLVLRGADVNLANFQGCTPLIMAAQQGHPKIVKFLVEKGAVVDQTFR